MTFLIFGLLLAGIIAYITLKPDTATIVTISSKHIVDSQRGFYVAKKKGDSNGDEVEDWVYYNDSGDKIKDKELRSLLFESFKNEDWYGDFNYYVDDSKYLSDITVVEDVVEDVKQEVEEPAELEKEERV